MRLIALPWENNIRRIYGGDMGCGWVNNIYMYNWCDIVNDRIMWNDPKRQRATSKEEAKRLVDIELVKSGWKLLNEGDKLLLLI